MSNKKSIDWFKDAKFGIFIHFGIYSVLAHGEWVMHNEKMTITEYEKLCSEFNPTKFSPEEWVALAKEAEAKYIVFATKHHDGFCMYESKLSDYNIVKQTPFKRDIVKELALECQKKMLKLFFYYSQLDWHHQDYFPLGRTGEFSGRPKNGIWQRYKDYYIGQVRELCTNYGEIGGFWFDGFWDKPDADWGLDELYNMIHILQPNVLITNNHHLAPFPGEDYQTFELDLPGENKAGLSGTAPISSLPKETSYTVNNNWGYYEDDNSHKSVEELIQVLINANAKGVNLLLNTGPLPDGTIQKEHIERFKAMGNFLKS